MTTETVDLEALKRLALAKLDLSDWLGWHEDGQVGVYCSLCGDPTRGEITLCLSAVLHNVVSIHRSCMIKSLSEGPRERSEEIIDRLRAGGPLFEEDE